MITPSFSLTATERVLLKMALDFTTASLDPRVTFTRALSTATRYNASGLVEVVAADAARFDFDPVALACKGLLIEEARTNVLTYSEQFDNVAWTAVNGIVSADATTSPDGTTNADKLVEGSGVLAGYPYVTRTYVTTAVSWSRSIYAKSAGRDWLVLRFVNSTSTNLYAWFNLATGLVGTVYTGLTATMTPVGDGWYRCEVTVTTARAGSNSQTAGIASADNSVAAYTGDGASGIYLWGAQLELGAFSTSYIPTTTTSVTRNADVATITGTNFSDWWQAGKGGALVQVTPSTITNTRPLVQFDDNTADNIIALRGNTTNPELQIVDGGTPQAAIDAGTIAANTPYSLTGWWDTNNCKARKDSGAVVTDTTATIPTVTQMRIGSDGTNYLNGTLATINYYDKFSSQIYTRRKNKAVFSIL